MATKEDFLPREPFNSSNIGVPAPGITADSTTTLQDLLFKNHQEYHAFFRGNSQKTNKPFHNHVTHHLFAAYAIGATPSTLKTASEQHIQQLEKHKIINETINEKNWKQHLGDENYYQAYLSFFNEQTRNGNLKHALEKYVLHCEDSGENSPRMLDRFLSHLLHSMIHFGHAAEFRVRGMAIEGLALAAVHNVTYEKLFDAAFFDADDGGETHAFSILAEVLADTKMKAVGGGVRGVLEKVGADIRNYSRRWTVKANDASIKARVEEVQWLVVIVFGLGGWKDGGQFEANFFLVHLVTSSMFLPSTLSLLEKADQVTLLRAYFAVCLAFVVSRGQLELKIQDFFAKTCTSLESDVKRPEADKTSTSPKIDPWHGLLNDAVSHRDEHYIKAQRALAHSATLYGHRSIGHFNTTSLTGADFMDGTLFVRVGVLLHGIMSLKAADPTDRWSFGQDDKRMK